MTEYAPSVAELLDRGQEGLRGEWPDYVEEHGFDESHVADLIRMAQDADLMWSDPDATQTYAPIHAWRVLGQLRAKEAIESLLTLLYEYDDIDTWPNNTRTYATSASTSLNDNCVSMRRMTTHSTPFSSVTCSILRPARRSTRSVTRSLPAG